MSFKEWRKVKLEDAVEFNPTERLKKGVVAKKVAMECMKSENNLEELDMSFKEWRKVKLEDAVEFNPTERLKKGVVAKKVAMECLTPFTRKVSNYEVTEFKGGTKFRNGDTLLARITPCLENGKTAYVDILDKDEIGFGSTEYIVLREKYKITDSKFIYYLSISPQFREVAIKSMNGSSGRQRVQNDVLKNTEILLPSLEEQKAIADILSSLDDKIVAIKSMNGSSGRQRVQNDVLKNTEILLPSLEEQKAIADILSSLDDKIELNNQMNKTLEEMAQALFKRWFVDFEFPNEEGKPYKSSGGEMVESELGMIPKGWKNGQLEDICGYSSNRIMIEKLDKNNYISTENMLPNKGGIIEASGLPTTSKVTSFNIGDTLISNIRPYFKKIYYCNQNGGCSNDVLCFNPKLKDYTYCLYLYLYEDNFFDYMMSGSKGTKMPRGDKKQIMRYPIVIANSDIYLKFNKIVSPMFEKLLTLKEENKNLIKLRDTLLPKLMSGEIRVSDLDS